MRWFHHKFTCNFIATRLLMHENECCYILRVCSTRKNMNWLMATKTGTIMNFNYFQTMENVTYYHPEHGVFT